MSPQVLEALNNADHWMMEAGKSGDIHEAQDHRDAAKFVLLRALLVEIAGLREDLAAKR